MKRLAVLRPEPGNAATAARIAAKGGEVLRLPLFAVRALAWQPPDPAAHDALLLTSANAVRQAGGGLAALIGLPVYAVGAATAAAARAAGLRVVGVGAAGSAALADAAVRAGMRRGLQLAGADRAVATLPGVTRTIAVYVSEPIPIDAARVATLADAVALIHSPRAGARLADLVADRETIALAAISAAALAAAGPGWRAAVVADAPHDSALVRAALALARAMPGAD